MFQLAIFLLVNVCGAHLKILGHSDTVYLEELPFTSVLQLEIGVQGAWEVRIEAVRNPLSMDVTWRGLCVPVSMQPPRCCRVAFLFVTL